MRRARDLRRWGRRAAALALVLGVVAIGWLAARRTLGWMAGWELFRIAEVELEGARFLSLEAAVEAAAVPAEAGIWDDPAEWLARLEAHPLVRSARVRRRVPGTLLFVVEEREPVALVPTPTLEAVDAEGRLLPIDLTGHTVDLPLLRVDGRAKDVEQARAALATEAGRLGRVDPEFAARVSELAAGDQDDLIVRWAEPAVTFRIPAAVSARRLREGVLVLAEAMAESGRTPGVVDLRFEEQVVVRRVP